LLPLLSGIQPAARVATEMSSAVLKRVVQRSVIVLAPAQLGREAHNT
jgi:hypothetical protein